MRSSTIFTISIFRSSETGRFPQAAWIPPSTFWGSKGVRVPSRLMTIILEVFSIRS
jgi:hypothetical protein